MQRRARSITSELFAPGTWGAIPTETLNSNSVSLSAFHLSAVDFKRFTALSACCSEAAVA